MRSAVASSRALFLDRQPSIRLLFAQPPTIRGQGALLSHLLASVQPILRGHNLKEPFVLRPGIRLRRRYGQCLRAGKGTPPAIEVRCTRDGAPETWRRPAAITGTLLHEVAHLRHGNHGPRFWALCRRLLDEAAAAGVYDPEDQDPSERAQGDIKLAGSAAAALAESARRAQREKRQAARAAAVAWRAGDLAVIRGRGSLAGATVTVVRRIRTRLQVTAADGLSYLVPAALLAEPGTANPAATAGLADRLGGWSPGDRAIVGGKGALAGTEASVVRRLRTRLEVVLGDGRHYLASPALLVRPEETASPARADGPAKGVSLSLQPALFDLW